MGGSLPGPGAPPWAFPMVFVVVLLLVVLVEFERWSDPVEDLGAPEAFLGLICVVFCVYFSSSGNIV